MLIIVKISEYLIENKWKGCWILFDVFISLSYSGCSVTMPLHASSRSMRVLKCSAGIVTVDGGWSPWTVSTACSVTCGTGQELQTRTCTNPVPAIGGRTCVGDASRLVACTRSPCGGRWTFSQGTRICLRYARDRRRPETSAKVTCAEQFQLVRTKSW